MLLRIHRPTKSAKHKARVRRGRRQDACSLCATASQDACRLSLPQYLRYYVCTPSATGTCKWNFYTLSAQHPPSTSPLQHHDTRNSSYLTQTPLLMIQRNAEMTPLLLSPRRLLCTSRPTQLGRGSRGAFPATDCPCALPDKRGFT